MEQEERQFYRRLMELAKRADAQNRYQAAHFLSEPEQDVVLQSEQEFPVAVSLFGGNAVCERKIAMFGSSH